MPELLPYAPGSPDWLAARRQSITHSGQCELLDWQPGRDTGPCPVCADLDLMRAAVKTRPALKLSPYSRTGMIHGAHQAAMSPRVRPGYHPAYARSWMYRRGFARAFLLAREQRHG